MEIVDVRIESCLNHWWITKEINDMNIQEKLEAVGCLEMQLLQGLKMPRIIDRYLQLCDNIGLKPRVKVKERKDGKVHNRDGN